MRRLFVLAVPLSLALTACTMERDMGGYDLDGQYDNIGVALGRDLGPYEARLRGDVPGFDGVDHMAALTQYSEPGYENVVLDVYDGNDWAMAGLDIVGDSQQLQIGDSVNAPEPVDYDSDDVAVYGIGCSNTFDEPFETLEVEVGAGADPDVKVIAFSGTFYDGRTLSGAYAVPRD